MSAGNVLKNKRHRIVWLVVALCVALFVALVGCENLNDSSFKDEDYIEVTALRFAGDNPTAEIRMSSSGVPSTYRLEVEVVPKNATNRALTYYIPSEYHQYVTVDSEGLLTAHRVSDGVNVPVQIRSTTNAKAVINASVLVEDVTVSAIRFEQKKVSLLYNGEGEQINFSYLPAHAIDGRNATFRSQNDGIATVSSSGFITPVGVGITHILVTCTTRSNKTIKNQLEVQVSYAAGQYQLEASGNASFNQVMGDYTPIEFSLLILGNNVDPSPKIQWYFDTQPVYENNDRLQYTHLPNAQTQMSYRIRVVVSPYQGDKVELYSDPITVYMAFNGITLTMDNQSDKLNAYRYGDTATFALNAGDASGTIAKYNWYIADYDDQKNRTYIGQTFPDDKDLTRRINVSGDYIVTSEAVNDRDDLVTQRTFEFSSEKLVEGDVLVVRPKLLDYGLPPDSYHWYTVECDENGNYDPDAKRWIADTASDEVLYLPVESGKFRFIVTASVEGVNAQVSVNGEKVPFEYVSDVVRVYSLTYKDDNEAGNNLIDETDPLQARFAVTSYQAVRDLTIEGIGRGQYEVFLRWNTVEGVPSYQIELTKADGSVVILDSEEGVAKFGANYCYVPRSVATLSDVFTVRIKQKRGLYSRPFSYGRTNERGTGDDTHVLTFDSAVYPYFETIGYNNVRQEYSSAFADIMNAPAVNGYVTDVADLQELLQFVLLYTPMTNTYVGYQANVVKEGALYNEYSVNVYVPFVYTEETEARYPHGLDEDTLATFGDNAQYAKLIYGALNALPYAFDFRLSVANGSIAGALAIVLDIPTGQSSVLRDTLTSKGKPSVATSYTMDQSEEVAIGDMPIDLKDAVYAYDSDEMVNAVVRGYRPVPNTDSLSSLYKLAKSVAVRIVSDGMTNKEIALAFFDYIGLNTIIDEAIEEERGNATGKYNLYLFEAFRVEGILLRNKGVDVGIAKTYALFCGLYGIPCRIVTGTIAGEERAWNKIYIDGAYYTVDIARSMYVIDGYSVVTHDLFMVSDEAYETWQNTEEDRLTMYGDAPASLTTAQKEAVPYIRTQGKEGLTAAFATVRERANGVYGVELTFSKSSYFDVNTIKDALNEITLAGISMTDEPILYHSDKDKLYVVTLVTVEKQD